MVKRKRNYKAEYRRRMAQALAKGLSRTQARGHRRANEVAAGRTRAQRALEDAKLQFALKSLRTHKSFTRAAKDAQISPERLRSYALEKGIVEKRGRHWVVKQDLPRRVMIYSDGEQNVIVVGKFDQASLVGKYMAAVRRFLVTNSRSHLKAFVGKSVTDINGKAHRFETRPNTLYRLTQSGGGSFEQVYRIVV